MLQNFKSTVSHSHLLSDSHSVPPADDKNTIKKVMSLNVSETGTKQTIKTDQKALNVKLKKYKTELQIFDSVCNNLKTSYETVKNFKVDSSANNGLIIEELGTTVKKTIKKQFGIHYPAKLTNPLKKNHEQYVSNLKTPILSSIIHSTSGHEKLYSAIKEAYEYVSKIFNVNMKYHFWLEMIVRQNEFCDLEDVQEYLIQNMFNNEQTPEQFDFNHFYSSLHSKLINIINEFGKVSKPETVDENIVIKENNSKDKILEMDIKIKNLEVENKKLKVTESEYCKKINVLLEELAFRNKKIMNAKSSYDLLTKEKKDLISIIEKTEVKEEGLYTLQKRFQEEQKKNIHLRTIIEKYENKNGSDFFKI